MEADLCGFRAVQDQLIIPMMPRVMMISGLVGQFRLDPWASIDSRVVAARAP